MGIVDGGARDPDRVDHVAQLKKRIAELEAVNAAYAAELGPGRAASTRWRALSELRARPKRELGDSYRYQIERAQKRGRAEEAARLQQQLAELIRSGEAL